MANKNLRVAISLKAGTDSSGKELCCTLRVGLDSRGFPAADVYSTVADCDRTVIGCGADGGGGKRVTLRYAVARCMVHMLYMLSLCFFDLCLSVVSDQSLRIESQRFSQGRGPFILSLLWTHPCSGGPVRPSSIPAGLRKAFLPVVAFHPNR